MEVLRAFRKRHGLTQVDVATQAGVPQASVAQYESGARSPSLKRLRALLGAFGQDVTIVPKQLERPHDYSALRRQLLHMRVAEHFVTDPEQVRKQAVQALDKTSHPYRDEWLRLLEPGNEIELIVALAVPSEANSGLLSASPFAGVLSHTARRSILSQARMALNSADVA